LLSIKSISIRRILSMYITRHVFTLKFITIIALATLFISAMSIMEAQALLLTIVRCPCSYLSALYLAKKEARKIGGSFAIDTCSTEAGEQDDDHAGLVAEGETGFPCTLEFEAENDADPQNPPQFECSYELTCGELLGSPEVDENEFFLAFGVDDLSDAEFEACRKEIKFISLFIYGVACTSNI
jgi:hypothetical protein